MKQAIKEKRNQKKILYEARTPPLSLNFIIFYNFFLKEFDNFKQFSKNVNNQLLSGPLGEILVFHWSNSLLIEQSAPKDKETDNASE